MTSCHGGHWMITFVFHYCVRTFVASKELECKCKALVKRLKADAFNQKAAPFLPWRNRHRRVSAIIHHPPLKRQAE